MRHIALAVLAVVLGCSESDSAKHGSAAGGSSRARAPENVSLEEIKEQACACQDQDCADRVNAELVIERRRFERTFDDAVSCLKKIDGEDVDGLLGKMRSFKDKVCSCANKLCVERVDKEMMEWATRNLDKMKNARPTKAQDEEADRIQDQMDKCKELIQGRGFCIAYEDLAEVCYETLKECEREFARNPGVSVRCERK